MLGFSQMWRERQSTENSRLLVVVFLCTLLTFTPICVSTAEVWFWMVVFFNVCRKGAKLQRYQLRDFA